MPRKPKMKPINLCLPPEMLAALHAEQARTGCSVAEFIRRATSAALAQPPRGPHVPQQA